MFHDKLAKNPRRLRGILGFKRGAILVSLCWVAILVYTIDRKWWQASIWALISAILTAVGVIHVPVSDYPSLEPLPPPFQTATVAPAFVTSPPKVYHAEIYALCPTAAVEYIAKTNG